MGQALARAGTGEKRAQLGLRLAQLALDGGDPAGARAALADTAGPDVPQPLQRARHLAEARALARQGDVERAVVAYREAGPEAAPELAEFHAARQAWAAAATVLRGHLAASLPAAPAPLPENDRRLLARFAALLALAGEEDALAALRDAEGSRMAGGSHDDAFSLLTAGRMVGVADLRRLPQELQQARALPGRLEGLRSLAAPAR
jgi:hypothetical protein